MDKRQRYNARIQEPSVATVHHDSQKVDVLIAGAGIVGLTLGVVLSQSLGASFSVAIADPALGRETANGRATAIVAAVRRLFETIGVWAKVPSQPIADMVVTDSRLNDAVRPTFLTFAEDVEAGEPFAHMVENRPLIAALVEQARNDGISLYPFAVRDCTPASARARPGFAGAEWGQDGSGRKRSGEKAENAQPDLVRHVEVELADGARLSPALLAAADGARSAIRERAGIAMYGWSYGQSAIVATVAHERDHGGRAEEHFLPAGPFAILPLVGRRSSIVWTEQTQEAERIASLPARDFHAELEQRFGLRLGEIEVIGRPHVHPLGIWVARSFIAERLALVGDAAHVIHPIAGQGLNMGLKDVAALAEVIVDAVRVGLDPGSLAVLARYQRWRRFDTMAMGVATDGLNRLFSNRSDVLRLARDVGLGLVDRFPALKRVFIREAAGLLGEVPKLLRGERL
jgi:2-octaprenyl-6-methoxyphenol hydroxylase